MNRNIRFYIESLQTFADTARDKVPADRKDVVTFEPALIRQLVGTIDALGGEYSGVAPRSTDV